MMINIDGAALNSLLAELKNIEQHAPRAINQAINRSLQHMRQAVVDEVVSSYNIKQNAVRKAVELVKSHTTTLTGGVLVSGSPIPLINFDLSSKRIAAKNPGRKNKNKPLGVSVEKNGAKKVIRGAFVQKTKSGYMGVFGRTTKASYPLMQYYGPAVPQMAQNALVSENVQTKATDYFFKRLDHEVARLNAGIGIR